VQQSVDRAWNIDGETKYGSREGPVTSSMGGEALLIVHHKLQPWENTPRKIILMPAAMRFEESLRLLGGRDAALDRNCKLWLECGELESVPAVTK